MDWHPEDDVTPTPHEVESMALLLESNHGLMAADIADFFSDIHVQRGDAGRAWAWQGVAERVRRRLRDRGGPGGGAVCAKPQRH